MDDVFAVQDEIAQAVVEKLKVKLLGERDAPMVRRPTDNLGAYNLLVLQGRYHTLRLTRQGLDKGLECFTQALAVDPVGAEREFRRALDLTPGDSLARCVYAHLLVSTGRADASVAEAGHAIEHDPLSVFARFMLAQILCLARRFDAAIAEARGGIELESTHPLHWNLGWALAGQGRYDEAVEAFEQATILAPGDQLSQAFLGWALGLARRRQESLTILGDLERRRTQEYVSCFFMALVHVGLGEREQAISRLEQAAEEHDPMRPHLNVWPGLDPLRADPRFQALLRRMNFPETARRPGADTTTSPTT